MMHATFVLAASMVAAAAAQPDGESIFIDRDWEVLPDPVKVGAIETLATAGKALGDWQLWVGGVGFDGDSLGRIVRRAHGGEPLLRALREGLRMPIDAHDFLLFLDDVLVAGAAGRRGHLIWVPSGRARKAGILLHPEDVFFAKPRRYAADHHRLLVDRPERPTAKQRARDGDLLGPGWTRRYRNPGGLAALAKARAGSTMHTRVGSLMQQLERAGASVFLMSTVRNRRRGYLMWGAFTLARAEEEATLEERLAHLEACNRDWGLEIDIRWRHPGGWQATREEAREMAAAFDVVFATETGARESNHYDGIAVDLVVRALPRQVTLQAPDGASRTFDLSDPEQSRDLSLTPELIDWIEEHFRLVKLRADYPHWDDAEVLPGEEPRGARQLP
jgi:hypothetical protein